jgi:hypothetical protein
MKRTLLRGLTLVICSAISRITAEPDPLSLIPDPTPTESRCAPTTITLSGSPLWVSAITLWVTYVTGRQSILNLAVSPMSPLTSGCVAAEPIDLLVERTYFWSI